MTDHNAQAEQLDRQAITARENGQHGTARDLEQQAQTIRRQMLDGIVFSANGDVQTIN